MPGRRGRAATGKGYTKQFKGQVVGLVIGQGYEPTRAAWELGMPHSTLLLLLLL